MIIHFKLDYLMPCMAYGIGYCSKKCWFEFAQFLRIFHFLDDEKLLHKLKHFGLCDSTVDWFKSYLTERVQKTVCNRTESTYQKVTYGIPQGSILGPLLFIIYVNNLPELKTKCTLKLYADDTLLISDAVNVEALQADLQADLNVISRWCNQNSLTINVQKSKHLLIDGSTSELKLEMNGVELEAVADYKYLGINIDSQMTFVQQVKNMFQSIRYKIWLLMMSRDYIDQYTSIRIMKSMLLPYFDYGLVFTTCVTNNLMYKFQVEFFYQNFQLLRNFHYFELDLNKLNHDLVLVHIHEGLILLAKYLKMDLLTVELLFHQLL